MQFHPRQPRKAKSPRKTGLFATWHGHGKRSFLRESRDERSEFYGTLLYNRIMYFVYILENPEKAWYIGFSADLDTRLKNHNSGEGGRTTKQSKNWKLIYYEAYLTKMDATGREKFLKSGSGRMFIKKQLKNYFDNPRG